MSTPCQSFQTQLQQVQNWQILQQQMLRRLNAQQQNHLPTYTQFVSGLNCASASTTAGIPISGVPYTCPNRPIAMSDESLFPVSRVRFLRNCV